MLEAFGKFIGSPVTGLVFAVVCLGIAFSGKLNMTATQALFCVAWVIALFGLRSLPWPLFVGSGAVLAGALLMLAYWARPELIPAYSGLLSSKQTEKVLFSPMSGGTITRLQIGQSGVIFEGPAGEIGKMLFPRLMESQIQDKIDQWEGKNFDQDNGQFWKRNRRDYPERMEGFTKSRLGSKLFRQCTRGERRSRLNSVASQGAN